MHLTLSSTKYSQTLGNKAEASQIIISEPGSPPLGGGITQQNSFHKRTSRLLKYDLASAVPSILRIMNRVPIFVLLGPSAWAVRCSYILQLAGSPCIYGHALLDVAGRYVTGLPLSLLTMGGKVQKWSQEAPSLTSPHAKLHLTLKGDFILKAKLNGAPFYAYSSLIIWCMRDCELRGRGSEAISVGERHGTNHFLARGRTMEELEIGRKKESNLRRGRSRQLKLMCSEREVETEFVAAGWRGGMHFPVQTMNAFCKMDGRKELTTLTRSRTNILRHTGMA